MTKLAALATGIELRSSGGVIWYGKQAGWQPHLNDGDAFRLQVCLGINTEVVSTWGKAVANFNGDSIISARPITNTGKTAAVRLAIVDVAAIIGQMIVEERKGKNATV